MRIRVVAWLVIFFYPTGLQLIFGSDINPVVTESAIFTLGDIQAAGLKSQGGIISAGHSALIGSITNDYYSQGNLTMMSTNVLGNITLGGSLSFSASRFASLSQISSPLYDFKSIRQSLIETSHSLGLMAPNGTSFIAANNNLLLTGTDPDFNVFRILNPNYYASIQVAVPSGATAIVNIMRDKPFLLQNNFNNFKNVLLDTDPSLVLFNFPQAVSLALNGSGFAGTLLAPLATSSISSSQIKGGIITNRLIVKSSDVSGDRFRGSFEPPYHAPEPRSIILAGIAILTCILAQARSIEQNSHSD